MKKLALLAPTLVAISALILFFIERSNLLDLQNAKTSLETELVSLKKDLLNLELERKKLEEKLHTQVSALGGEYPLNVPSDIKLPATPAPQVDSEEKPLKGHTQWMAKSRITDVEQFITLTDEQKEQLSQRYQELFENPKEDSATDFFDPSKGDQRELEVMADVVGVEAAQEYSRRKTEQRERFEKERVDQEVYSLARKLTLSPDQEGQVRTAVGEVREEMKAVQEEAYRQMSENLKGLHTGSNNSEANFEAVTKMMKDMRNRKRELLNSRLRGILSDEQFNSLLADQATTPDSFMGFMR